MGEVEWLRWLMCEDGGVSVAGIVVLSIVDAVVNG